MSRHERADVVIVGGGLAGLSLAWRLADPAFGHRKVIILEPRKQYTADRTWSYWRLCDHPFQPWVGNSWQRWRLTTDTGTTTCASTDHPYQRLPADRLYAAAVDRIQSAAHIRLRLGCSVDRLVDRGAEGVLVTGPWGAMTASLAFDSRPQSLRPGALVQHFCGWEIETPTPSFQTDTVTLMDFRVAQQGAIHFVYVLPLSPCSALIEDTWISRSTHPRDTYAQHLRHYLMRYLKVTDYRLFRQEEGCIPMDPALRRPRQRSRIVQLGTRGGMVRAASGYGFLQIQRDSDELARQLAGARIWRDGIRSRQAPGVLARLMDSVFLGYLDRHPEKAPELFRLLFAGCPAQNLVRFLGGVGSLCDHLAVIAALPKLPLVAQVFRGRKLRAA